MHSNIPNAFTIILSLTFFQYSQFLTSFTSKNWWPFLSHRLPCLSCSETTRQVTCKMSLHKSTDLYLMPPCGYLFLQTQCSPFPFWDLTQCPFSFLHMLAIMHTLHILLSTLCTTVFTATLLHSLPIVYHALVICDSEVTSKGIMTVREVKPFENAICV